MINEKKVFISVAALFVVSVLSIVSVASASGGVPDISIGLVSLFQASAKEPVESTAELVKRRPLFLAEILDCSPIAKKDWDLLKTLLPESVRSLQQGDRFELLAARPGEPIMVTTNIVESNELIADTIAKAVSGISKEWLFGADVAKAMTQVLADFNKSATEYQCCLIVLTTGQKPDGQVLDIQRISGTFEARGWQVCLVCNEKKANRKIFVVNGEAQGLDLRFSEKPRLREWVESMRSAKGTDTTIQKQTSAESATARKGVSISTKSLDVAIESAESQTMKKPTFPGNKGEDFATNAQMKAYEEDFAKAKDEMNALKQKIQGLQNLVTSKQHEAERQIVTFDERAASMEDRINNLNAENDNLEARKRELRLELDSARTEVGTVKQQLTEITNQKAKLETELHGIAERSTRLTQKYKDEPVDTSKVVGKTRETNRLADTDKSKPNVPSSVVTNYETPQNAIKGLGANPKAVGFRWMFLLFLVCLVLSATVIIAAIVNFRQRDWEICTRSSSAEIGVVSNLLILTPRSDVIPLRNNPALRVEPKDGLGGDGVPFLSVTRLGRVFIEPGKTDIFLNDQVVTRRTRIRAGDTFYLGKSGNPQVRHILTGICRADAESLEDYDSQAVPTSTSCELLTDSLSTSQSE
jgi:predicted  nucleic acid-binding Zn-ribbon protein